MGITWQSQFSVQSNYSISFEVAGAVTWMPNDPLQQSPISAQTDSKLSAATATQGFASLLLTAWEEHERCNQPNNREVQWNSQVWLYLQEKNGCFPKNIFMLVYVNTAPLAINQ